MGEAWERGYMKGVSAKLLKMKWVRPRPMYVSVCVSSSTYIILHGYFGRVESLMISSPTSLVDESGMEGGRREPDCIPPEK